MKKPKGIFIVIEGSDGSGKSTHFSLLLEHLKAKGREVAMYKFPQYDKPSSYFSVAYLNGQYGDANKLGAYKPSLFYALDRFEAASSIRKDLADGKIVLCDRYVGSNMAHQGQKLADKRERRAYFDWIYNLEFNILGIPKPDVNLVLLMPAKYAYEFAGGRERAYTTQTRDAHEADKDHIERAIATYRELCQLYPETFHAVRCSKEDETLHSIDEIQSVIRTIIHKKLITS